jgi:hypothetical protein
MAPVDRASQIGQLRPIGFSDASPKGTPEGETEHSGLCSSCLSEEHKWERVYLDLLLDANRLEEVGRRAHAT